MGGHDAISMLFFAMMRNVLGAGAAVALSVEDSAGAESVLLKA